MAKPVSGTRPIQVAQRIDRPDEITRDGLLEAAAFSCSWPKQPEIAKGVQIIVQKWMNWTGLPEPKAIETLKMRLQPARFAADKKKLCDALTIDEEQRGEDKVYMSARRTFFGCGDDFAMWEDDHSALKDDTALLAYLDLAVTPADEIVRLAFLQPRARYIVNSDLNGEYIKMDLVHYITDQLDFAALDEGALTKLLDQAPYKGNSYARTIAAESMARTKYQGALIKAFVAKKATDAAWKELLITAPQKGAADWQAAAAKWKDQIARSNDFEKTFYGPSKNAMKGCLPKLEKDFLDVVKPLNKGNATAFQQALSDPVASLLASRLLACASIDADGAFTEKLYKYVVDLRPSRGPRIAAYFAALDALAKIKDDRAKFPVAQDDLKISFSAGLIADSYQGSAGLDRSKIDTMGFIGDGGTGTVKALKKAGDVTSIAFAKTRIQVMSQSCTETGRIIQWRADGSPIYYQSCKDTGLVWIDTTPDPVNIPNEWTGGIKAGSIVEFVASRGEGAQRKGLPLAVYADKTKKKLINWLGFGL